MKKAVVIGHVSVKNPEKWEQYKVGVPATLAPWNAQLVFRGGLESVLSGQHAFEDTVVLEFDNLAAAHNWFESPEYQALIPLREQAADITLLVYEQSD